MNDNSIYKRVYFIGGGGIGMAALERYFLSQGLDVAAYDRTPSELTARLESESVAFCYDDDPAAAVPDAFRDPADTLVVFTPAVPADSAVMRYFAGAGHRMIKRAEALGIVTRRSRALCFAGTHGKTTTSAMAAHVLHTCSVGCNAFLGGILRNYDSNLLLAPASPWTVAEADEYDRSFHRLQPHIAVITATDPDHLDIYGTEEAYLESFAHFTELIRPGGALVAHTGLKLKPRPGADVSVFSYSRSEGDFHADRIRVADGTILFDFVHPGGRIADIELGVPVDINIENAAAALAACWLTGDLEPDAARRAMASFMGTERRFQFLLKQPRGGRVIIDDYAHHPDELRTSIASVRALYPDRHLTVAFQPHLYTRTRDFAAQFADALSGADAVVLTDIYPARELPIPGVTSDIIFRDVRTADKTLIHKDNLVDWLKNRNFDILLACGAGDMSLLLPQVAAYYRS